MLRIPSSYLRWIILLTLSLFLLALPSLAVKVETVPNPRQTYSGWVTDQAQMLSPQAERQLNQMIGKLEAQNGTEIAIVTVPDTLPYLTPKAFTTKLFNHWGIGKWGKNNGVLFMVSQGDRRVEIETGRGMQKILPNQFVKKIIDKEIIPRFKQQQYEAGILAGTKALIAQVVRLDRILPSPGDNRPWFSYIPIYIWIIGVLGMVWSLITAYWLIRKIAQPITLAPNAYFRHLPENNQLYEPLCESVTISDKAKASLFLLPYFQSDLISPYLHLCYFSLALVAIALTYIANWAAVVSAWNNSIFLLIGIISLFAIDLFGLMRKQVIFRYYAFLFSWVVFAVSLSGRTLNANILFVLLTWVYVINVCMTIVKLASRDINEHKESYVDIVGFFLLSVFVLIFLVIIRPFLPFLGSFVVLVVIPAFLIILRKIFGFDGGFGCLFISGIIFLVLFFMLFNFIQDLNPSLAPVLSIPIDYTYEASPFDHINFFGIIFPNPLLVSIFMGLNLFLFLSVMVSPTGARRFLTRFLKRRHRRDRGNSVFVCSQCGDGMELIWGRALEDYLNSPQQVALALGSLECFAWKCNSCHQHLPPPGIHLLGYLHRTSSSGDRLQFEDCPYCLEATLVRSEIIIEKPTWSTRGTKLIRHECSCCDYRKEEEISMSVKPLPAEALLISPRATRSEFQFDEIGKLSGELERPVHCQDCSNEMTPTPQEDWNLSLTPEQEVAQHIGGLKIKAYHCENCGQLPTESHICLYRHQGDSFKKCPTCDEITMTVHERTIVSSGPNRPGRGSRYERCHCCGLEAEEYYEIPPRPSTSRRSSRDDSSSSWGGDDSSGSWGSDNSSSSDFGGGGSDGDGAGGDW